MDERFFKSDYVAFRHVESGVDAISWFNLFSSSPVCIQLTSKMIRQQFFSPNKRMFYVSHQEQWARKVKRT